MAGSLYYTAVLMVLLKVWLFDLWMPEVPKHIKDVGRGKRKTRRCFLAVSLLCEAASPVYSVDPAALCVSVRLHVILPLFRPEIQHRFPLFYTQICSYSLFCPVSLHFVMIVKLSVISQKRAEVAETLLTLCSLWSLEVTTLVNVIFGLDVILWPRFCLSFATERMYKHLLSHCKP